MNDIVVRIKGLTKFVGSRQLYKDAEALVRTKDRIGVIGKNGSGKTTLIRCIFGEEFYDGVIELDKNIKYAIMEQEGTFKESDQTFNEYVESKQVVINQRKAEIEERLSDEEIYQNMHLYEQIMNEYLSVVNRAVEIKVLQQRISEFLKLVNFKGSLDVELRSLSGGQRTQLRLAECLSRNADLIVLDEPTNHLDFEARSILEKYLLKLKKTIIAISHDRFFLNNIATKIMEIENMKFVTYSGNYSEYSINHKEHISQLASNFSRVKKQKDRLEASAKEKRDWAHRSKSKTLKMQAERLERRAKELPDAPNPDRFEDKYRLAFKKVPRSGGTAFVTDDLSLTLGDKELYSDVNLTINKGDKVAIIGKNGTGKTSLLRILAGKLKVEGLTKSHDLKIGYFDQEFKDMKVSKDVLSFMKKELMGMEDHRILAYLVATGFPREKFKMPLHTLSGGEKARLNLVRLMLSGYNTLLLDEPINNLDLSLVESLERGLLDFKGTVVFVSHDRYFIKKVATTVYEIEDREVEEQNINFLFENG